MAGKKKTQDGRSHPKSANPLKPVSLTPARLNNDPGRQIVSQDITSRDIPIVSFGDHSAPAMPISENRYGFAPVNELRPEMKQEQSRSFQLRPIAVTPVQMQQLRERRVAARELGWTIPGHRIRIGN